MNRLWKADWKAGLKSKARLRALLAKKLALMNIELFPIKKSGTKKFGEVIKLFDIYELMSLLNSLKLLVFFREYFNLDIEENSGVDHRILFSIEKIEDSQSLSKTISWDCCSTEDKAIFSLNNLSNEPFLLSETESRSQNDLIRTQKLVCLARKDGRD